MSRTPQTSLQHWQPADAKACQWDLRIAGEDTLSGNIPILSHHGRKFIKVLGGKKTAHNVDSVFLAFSNSRCPDTWKTSESWQFPDEWLIPCASKMSKDSHKIARHNA